MVEITQKWTNTAIDCYLRKTCEGCMFQDYFAKYERKCMMKQSVIELVRVLGKPKTEIVQNARGEATYKELIKKSTSGWKCKKTYVYHELISDFTIELIEKHLSDLGQIGRDIAGLLIEGFTKDEVSKILQKDKYGIQSHLYYIYKALGITKYDKKIRFKMFKEWIKEKQNAN